VAKWKDFGAKYLKNFHITMTSLNMSAASAIAMKVLKSFFSEDSNYPIE